MPKADIAHIEFIIHLEVTLPFEVETADTAKEKGGHQESQVVQDRVRGYVQPLGFQIFRDSLGRGRIPAIVETEAGYPVEHRRIADSMPHGNVLVKDGVEYRVEVLEYHSVREFEFMDSGQSSVLEIEAEILFD